MLYKSNFFHHILGIVIANAGLCIIPDHQEPLICKFFIIEASTVCLDFMWLLRAFGRESTLAYSVSLYSFMSLFVGLRSVCTT